jgi:ABC-type cobalamin/Fe3+-siderophores transport systems, ATPase components
MTVMNTVHVAPLACRGLGLQLSGNTVLCNIDLNVVAGETLGIVGPNGSGKSSLLKLLAGLRTPGTGSVQLLGEPLARLPRRRVAQALALVERRPTPSMLSACSMPSPWGARPWLSALAPFSREDRAIVEQALADLDATHLG